MLCCNQTNPLSNLGNLLHNCADLSSNNLLLVHSIKVPEMAAISNDLTREFSVSKKKFSVCKKKIVISLPTDH